jgi:hypothetical protein
MTRMNWKSYGFNQLSILIHAPATSGVYLLHNSTRCLFIGESSNIRDQLLGHLHGDRPVITLWDPSGFCFEPCPEALRIDRKRQLALLFQPAIWERDYGVDVYQNHDTVETAATSLPRR